MRSPFLAIAALVLIAVGLAAHPRVRCTCDAAKLAAAVEKERAEADVAELPTGVDRA